MKKRIFHKVLIPALVVMLMTPFCITVVKADATNQQILDMLTSIRSQVVYILQTQRVGSTGNYDTIDYLQKMDTNLLELDTHLTEIMADMTAAWDQTDPIQTDNYFESILNYFKAFYDGIGSSSTHLYYIRGNTASMVTALNNISSDLDHISTKIDELVTLVSNIDNTIDMISWNQNTYLFKFSISLNGEYVDNLPSDTLTKVFVRIQYPSNAALPYDEIINKIKFGLYSSYSATPLYYVHLDGVYKENGANIMDHVYYYNNNSYGNTVYMDSFMNSVTSLDRYIIFEFSVSEGYIRYNSNNTYFGFINSNDIEYWQLLTFFNQYNNWNLQLNKSDTIINKLDTMINGNSTSDTIVNQNNNLNQQLQTSVTQYDQVENQFKESFSTNMNQISKPDLSNIVSAAAWYTTQLTSLFNASGSFQIIYVLPLVLGIALFFIGRGAVAFRQSSNQETRWVETVKDENGFTTRHGTIRSETVRGKGRYR